MYRYYDFKKIFEAEQVGDPLNPTDMGISKDFSGYSVEIVLTTEEIESLKAGGELTKNDAKRKNVNNLADSVDIPTLTITKSDSDNEELITEGDTVILKLKEETINRIVIGIEEGGIVSESVSDTQITFTKSDESTEATQDHDIPEDQISAEAGMEMPNESVQPRKILSFNQFLAEGKESFLGDAADELREELKKEEAKKKKKIGGKPDYLDFNKNGNRKEPMKKAIADVKKKKAKSSVKSEKKK